MADAPRPQGLRFCLITSGHISTSPRVVKEADALVAAGHRVRVVAMRLRADFAERDRDVMSARGWTLHTVNADKAEPGGRARWLADAIVQRTASAALARGVSLSGRARDRAASRHLGALSRAASAAPADVVIGHTLPALPAAARTAARLRASLGFDLEDLHSEEPPPLPRFETARALAAAVEREYLPRCDLLTASSDDIADEATARYAIRRPRVVLNVFPRGERRAAPRSRPAGPVRAPSLYWFSLTIGPSRGIEDALAAMATLDVPVELHLRGNVDPHYAPELRALVTSHGLDGRVHLLPAAAPSELVALAGEHDIGLALEPGFSLNNRLAASNKLFTFMLAGIAVAASDTPGQRRVMRAAPGAGFLYPPTDARSLAAGLRALVAAPGALAEAKRRAAEVAERRFCWDVEQATLVNYLTAERSRPQLGRASDSGAATSPRRSLAGRRG